MKNPKWMLCILVVVGYFLVQAHPGWTSSIFEVEPNDSFEEAQSLEGHFSIDFNKDIFNSTTVPHVSVQATNGPTVNDVDYYSFSVAEAGQTGYFDIDYGLINGSYIDDVDTTLSLFDSSYNLLAFSDDSIDTDSGTVSIRDSFIGEYTFNAPGTYYIAVSNWGNYPTVEGTEVGPLFRPDGVEAGVEYAGDSGPSAVTEGIGTWIGDYTLHASLSEAASPVPELLIVSLDIRPGRDHNIIYPRSRRKIPLAILSTMDFYAPAEVDTESLTFGPVGDEESLAFCNPSPEDVNDDGYDDLVCYFYTRNAGFQCGDEQGILRGYTVDEIPIEGSDSVRIVLCKEKIRKIYRKELRQLLNLFYRLCLKGDFPSQE